MDVVGHKIHTLPRPTSFALRTLIRTWNTQLEATITQAMRITHQLGFYISIKYTKGTAQPHVDPEAFYQTHAPPKQPMSITTKSEDINEKRRKIEQNTKFYPYQTAYVSFQFEDRPLHATFSH